MKPHPLIVVASPYDPNDNTQPENQRPRNTNSVSPNHHTGTFDLKKVCWGFIAYLILDLSFHF
jgi:hypothetical protein